LVRRAAFTVATLCRPDSQNEKIMLKLSQIELLKNIKNGFDRSVDRSVELHFAFCLQQKLYGGWGRGCRTQAEGRKRDCQNRRN